MFWAEKAIASSENDALAKAEAQLILAEEYGHKCCHLENRQHLYVYEKNNKKALELLRQSARAGHLEAQRTLGTPPGYGGWQDVVPSPSLSWLKKSAEGGNTGAQRTLSFLYMDGEFGLEKDMKQAFYWRERAAHNDPDTYSLLKLADLYFENSSVKYKGNLGNFMGDQNVTKDSQVRALAYCLVSESKYFLEDYPDFLLGKKRRFLRLQVKQDTLNYCREYSQAMNEKKQQEAHKLAQRLLLSVQLKKSEVQRERVRKLSRM